MDLTNIVNKKGGVHHPQFADHSFSFIKPEQHSMERSASPHGSEHSHYSNPHMMSRGFPSTAAMQAPMHMQNPMSAQMSMGGFPDMSGMGGVPNMGMGQMSQPAPHQSPPHPVKAYPCSTCGKGFARKSDLARHERIHSGDRPHMCDFPSCGKMFIQRSALTVHQRVHTGEKPHHCETCAKRFSDSSSLARHRRTHFGTRPYKCPYADCQKTFTRRTTLTRHQNQHSGTIEEAAAATAAALAASKVRGMAQARSDGDHMSSHGSPMTTPSPANRTMSMSPSVDLSAPNVMNRHSGDFSYMQQGGPLPPHMRVASPAPQNPTNFNTMRPTSHPTSYGPPPTLEPNLEQHQSTSGSSGGSPHMASVSWQSPAHVPSPAHHANAYLYSDADAYQPGPQAMSQMYYAAAPHMRRPQGHDAGLVHMA